MATPKPHAAGPDPRQFSPPTTAEPQTENTVDIAIDAQSQAAATQVDHDDKKRQREQAPCTTPDRDTTQLPEPGDVLENTPTRSSGQTEQRIERELERAKTTGEVVPRSVIAPAKPAREPNEDEQRMAEDFDPPPLGHRPEVGS